MNLRIFTQPSCIVALLWASSAFAHASTIQYNYGRTVVNFLTGGSVNAALQGFDPALGTLSAIDVTYSASDVLLQGDAQSSNIAIYDDNTLLARISFPPMVGRDQQLESGGFLVPAADWSGFETAGLTDLTFTPFTACRGTAATPSGCNEFTASVSGAVAYTYTPASSVPEPGSFILIAIGLIVVGIAGRVR
jgi:hypothetical protein